MEKYYLFLLLWLFFVTKDASGAAVNPRKPYEGDKVLTINTPEEADFQNLVNVLKESLPIPDVDVWREPTPDMRSADVYVKHNELSIITGKLREHGFTSHLFIDNVQELVDHEFDVDDNITESSHRVKRDVAHAVQHEHSIVNKFARHAEILEWQRQLMLRYPFLVTLYNIGKTHEDRQMQVIRVGKDVGRWKPAIFMDAAMHAREWIAPSTAVYIINHLLVNYWINSTIRTYVDKIDWYFLVIANPDGYEYTHDTFRLWRKNMKPLPPTPTRLYPCTGVDLNRNWGFSWGGENAALEPCDIMYRGETAMSEPEVQHIANFILDRKDCIRFYISLHSYTQYWFTRWSFADFLPPDHEELLELAQRAVKAINNTHGYKYHAGTSPRLLYVFSGGSADWAKGEAGIKYSYLIELRDRGEYGFLLPQSQIIPTGEEIWAGMDVVAQQALHKYPVSVPIEEEDESPQTSPKPATSQPHEQTSLPQTIQPSDGPHDFHSEEALPYHSTTTASPGGDDETLNNRDVTDDVRQSTNDNGDTAPDLSNGSNNNSPDTGGVANSGSSPQSQTPPQSQNVLLAEVLFYLLYKLTS